MTARGLTALSRPLRGVAAAVGAIRTGAAGVLLPALATSVMAALLLAVAPLLTVVRAGDGSGAEPAFMSAPLLAALAVAPAVAAWSLAGFGRPAAAAGLLGSLALLAVGRTAIDAQLLTDPWSAARPELLVPSGLAELTAGPAVPVLLLGHGLTVVAGLLALVALRGAGRDAGQPAMPREGISGSGTLVAALCAGTLAAAGLVSRQFRSTDPYLAPSAAVDAPLPTLLGTLLVAGGVVLAACLAASAADVDTARGGLIGAAAGVVIVALPPLVAVASSDSLDVSAGPFVALGGAALLAGAGWLAGRPPSEHTPTEGARGEVRLPAAVLMHRVAAVLALASGAAGLLGAVTGQLAVTGFTEPPVVYPARLLVPAGVLLAVLGALMLVPRLASTIRPALAVGWAAMPLAATATLDVALTATQMDGMSAGFGVWPTALALLLAPAAGLVAAVAGGAERDEVDLTPLDLSQLDLSQRRADRVELAVGGLAAALAVPAFGVPLVTSRDYLPAGLWSRFSVASWGLLAAAVVVVVAGLLAPRLLPSRAVALLVGAVAVIAVHLCAVPLLGGRGEAPESIAAGTWFALACGLALLGAALVAGRRGRRDLRNIGRGARTKYAPERLGTSGRPARRPGARRPDARRSRERSNPRGRRKTGT